MIDQIEALDCAKILANDDFNCRGTITPLDVADLAKSIGANGLKQAVSVAALTPELRKEIEEDYNIDTSEYDYFLIMGFRRFMAVGKVLASKTINATIDTTVDKLATARVYNLLENLHRKDLNILQEAYAIKKLKDKGFTREILVEKLGMSWGWIRARFYLLELPIEIQEEAAAGIFNQTDITDLRSTLTNDGLPAVMEHALELKKAKETGRRHMTKKAKDKEKKTKKHRKKGEIVAKMEHIYALRFDGLTIITRVLAWASGEITEEELDRDLRELCEEQNRTFVGR